MKKVLLAAILLSAVCQPAHAFKYENYDNAPDFCIEEFKEVFKTIKNEDDAIYEKLQFEEDTRMFMDDYLSKRITAETNARQKADTILQQNIDKEVTTRISEDDAIKADLKKNWDDHTKINNKLNTEINNRTEANKALSTSITNIQKDYRALHNAEVDARQFGDEILQGNIDVEAALREYYDEQHQTQLNNHENRIQNNTENIQRNTQEINNVKTDLKNNWDDHKQMHNQITNNTQQIQNNAKNIQKVDQKVDYNHNMTQQQISNLSNRMDQNYNQINQRINKLDDKIEGGLATVSALTALHPNPRCNTRTQIAVGAGMYADNVAGAVGLFHWINDRIMLNAGASYGGGSQWAGNCGLSIGIGKMK